MFTLTNPDGDQCVFGSSAEGFAERIHVIHAAPEQRQAIEDALAQWRFKPYPAAGKPLAVETGLLFELPTAPAP